MDKIAFVTGNSVGKEDLFAVENNPVGKSDVKVNDFVSFSPTFIGCVYLLVADFVDLELFGYKGLIGVSYYHLDVVDCVDTSTTSLIL